MDEYVHLLSGENDNKARFTNQLGKQFTFDHNDEVYCALKEISFSCNLKTEYIEPKSSLERDKLRLAVSQPHITGMRFVEVRIPSGYYSAQSLVSVINTRISASMGPEFQEKDCHLYYNFVTRRIEFFTLGIAKDPATKVSLLVFPTVTKILGLQGPLEQPEAFLLGSRTSLFPGLPSKHPIHAVCNHPPSLKSFDLVLVYLSILKRQCVGHDLVQLADILAKAKCTQGNSYLTYRVKNCKYIKIAPHLRTISDIEVALANENGELLEFSENNRSETRVTLHFLSKSLLKH